MTVVAEDVIAGHGTRRGLLMQVVAMLAMGMSQVVYGMSLVFAGIFNEQLTSTDADIKLSLTEISWVSSIVFVGNMLGCLVSSYVNPLMGAIRVCQLCSPLLAGGCLLLAYGGNFWVLFAGRFLVGLFLGVMVGPCNTYVGEIASPRIRGLLTSSLITMMMVGVTCTYLTSWLLGWRKMCLVMGITPMVLMFVVTLMLPRSPRWLVTKGYPVEEAQRSLRFYFGHDFDVDKEVKDIQGSLGDGHDHEMPFWQVLAQLRYRQNVIPLFLIITLISFLVFSGGSTTTAFAPVIFKSVGWFTNPYISSILLGVIRIFATIICGIVLNKLHRRTLLVLNSVVGGLGCLAAGCYFFYRDQLSDCEWIPLISVLVIVLFMSLGISPLHSVLMSELLPNSIRSAFGGICFAYYGTTNFIMVYAFPLVLEAIGMSGVYWFFTVMHLVMLIFSTFFLPDTNGKSIEEIQKMFTKKTADTSANQVDTETVKESTNL